MDGVVGHNGPHVQHHVVTPYEPVIDHVITQHLDIKEIAALEVLPEEIYVIGIHTVRVCSS